MKHQFEMWQDRPVTPPSRDELLGRVQILREMHQRGELGGERMPEDSNPGLAADSAENYHYFTLSMSLNYQRNSYTLWQCANTAYLDAETRAIFEPSAVTQMSDAELSLSLLKHRVALQPVRHVRIWRAIATAICRFSDGDIRNLFRESQWSAAKVIDFVQNTHKPYFPYLSGNKICNYWLHVIERYTDAELVDREHINVAPDTHVLRSSIEIGLVPADIRDRSDCQAIVSTAWETLLAGTGILPIDVHTPLWLWSRGGCVKLPTAPSNT